MIPRYDPAAIPSRSAICELLHAFVHAVHGGNHVKHGQTIRVTIGEPGRWLCRGDNWDDDWDEDAEPPSLPQLANQKPAAPAESADKFAGEDEGEEEPSYVIPESQKVH